MRPETDPNETMDFEDLLEKANGYGRYQIKLVLLYLLPVSTMIAIPNMNHIFLMASPPHGCRNPIISSTTNFSTGDNILLTRPVGKDGLPDSCRMYNLNYSQVLQEIRMSSMNVSSYVSLLSPNWTTTSCKYGWDYDKSLYKRTVTTDWDLVCDKDYFPSLVFTLLSAGSCVATPIIGALSDRFGRRKAFHVVTAILVVSLLLVPIIPTFTGFLTARVVQASTSPSNYQLPYLVLLEIVSPDKRERINAIGCLVWSLGLGILTLIIWLTSNWIWLAWSSVIVSLTFVYSCWIVPESPRWLISQERFEEAKEILQKMAEENKRDISHLDIISLLKKCSHKDQSIESQDTFKELIRKRILLKRFVITVVVWTSAQIAYFAFNLNVAALNGNEFLNFLLLSLVEFPSYLLSWYMINTRLGRRWSNVIFMFLTSAFCFLPIATPEHSTVFLTVASLVGKFGVSASFLIIYQQCTEVFPTALRSTSLSLSGTVAQLLALSSPSIIYLGKYGRHIPYTMIACMCFISGFAAFFIPETLNENLPQTLEDGEQFGKNQPFFSLAKTKSCLKNKSSSEMVLEER